MWHYLLILILLNNINCIVELNGTFKVDYFSSEYITQNNDILIYEPKGNSLYISKSIPNSQKYQASEKLSLNIVQTEEPQESFYFNFVNIHPNSIQVSYFNEEYQSSFIFEENKTDYSYISIEKIGNDSFAILLNANETYKNENVINIATFDFHASDENKFNITKTYTLKNQAKRVHSNCITIKGNNIVCALTEKNEDTSYYYYNYRLILLNNENETILDQKDIYNTHENIYTYYDDDDDDDDYWDDDDDDYWDDDDDDYWDDDDDYWDYDDDYDYDYDYDYDDVYLYSTMFIDEYNNSLIYKFFKIFSLENEKILYCYRNKSGIYCGLAQIKNNEIEIVYEEIKIFASFSFNSKLARNCFDAITYKDDKIGLSLATSNGMEFALLKLTGNSFIIEKTSKDLYSRLDKHSPFYAKLLKNNNNDLILFMLNGDSKYSENLTGYIDELEVITCSNSSIKIYNADNVNLKFIIYASFIIDDDVAKSIYLFNVGNELNSLFHNDEEPIEENTKYYKDNIYYNYTSEDYNNYIKNNSKYKVGFTNSLEADSQRCIFTIDFLPCKKKKCEFCNENNKCWDENWKFIYFKSDFEKIFFIFPVSILVMLIVLLSFTFAKCCMKGQIPNYGGENLIQNEMPLITT